MERSKRVLLFIQVLFITSVSLYAATPWLHVDGNQIKDSSGNQVVLRGVALVDLGHVELWREGVTTLIDRLTDETDTQGSSPGWYTRIVRLAVYPSDQPGFNSPWFFDTDPDDYYNNLLRPVVDYCASKGLYVIIDWHYVGINTYDKISSTSAFWTYIAPKFAGDSNVLFELFNEPDNRSGANEAAKWESCRADMQTWTNIIRASAPDNLILVGCPQWSQIIAPAATNPVTGGNIVYVSHIYPDHWGGGSGYYVGQISTVVPVHPVMITEWGFILGGAVPTSGTLSGYGQPIVDFMEANKISYTAWCSDYDWGPPMFNSDWTLRCGENYMGCLVKDSLYLKRNSDQPGGGGDTTAPADPTGLTASLVSTDVSLDWNDNGESDLYGYHVYRSTTSGTVYTKITSSPVVDSDYIDTTTLGGNVYFYVVTAVDTSSNESGNSNEDHVWLPDLGMGSVLRQWWTGISGTSISDLLASGNYPDDPSGSDRITRLEGPLDWDDDYGTRIRGYLHPPATGDYTFWVAGDDDSELWLSTDGNPANISMIAEVPGYTNSRQWDKYPAQQQSSAISLTAGQKYYIEVLHKEGAGGDNIAVAWDGPGLTQQVIDGPYLSRWFIGLYGEFTGDGIVDIEDVAFFVALWLNDDCVQTAGLDLDGDCVIGLYEFSNMAQNWNGSP